MEYHKQMANDMKLTTIDPRFLFVDLEGLYLSESEIQRLKHPSVAGVILFSRNFSDSAQLKELIQSIKSNTSDDFIISVDHEGGRVQRFKDDKFTHLPSMLKLSEHVIHHQTITLNNIEDIGWLMAVECIAHGINLSFAPVLDIDNGADVIGDRAFGKKANEVSLIASAFMAGMREAGLPTVGKHFPGHGSTKLDSHIHTPIDARSRAAIESTDLPTFKSAIANNELDAIMPAHVVFSKVADLPVGYSSVWLQEVLRSSLNFEGIIFSDDLSMAGAGLDMNNPLDYRQRVTKAMSAGCDYVLICNQPEQVDQLLSDSEILVPSFVAQPDETKNCSAVRKEKFLSAIRRQNLKSADDLMKSSRYHQTKTLITKIKSL